MRAPQEGMHACMDRHSARIVRNVAGGGGKGEGEGEGGPDLLEGRNCNGISTYKIGLSRWRISSGF